MTIEISRENLVTDAEENSSEFANASLVTSMP